MSRQYEEYLRGHIENVNKAAQWIGDNIGDAVGLDKGQMVEFMVNASYHDDSKRSLTEYGPYDAYFYGEKDEDAFNRAWLHHIHENPHHWQHWLLMNDDGKYRDPDKVIPLEMPRVYALEMVADWWSFSWRSGNLMEMFDWYEEHKDNIILHPNTRRYVEDVLAEIREGLKTNEPD